MSSFESFKATFKGDIVTPDDAEYEVAIARWSIGAERKAKYVAYVKDADDVVSAIKFSVSEGLPIAIRGGGHNVAGASSSENGLVIDLSRYVTNVEVLVEEKLAKIGGGCVWAHVDEAAIEHGLATVGGTVNHTGVGGLILGGGHGWLSAAHGLVVDNLVQATVVTASGKILTASATSEPELFWGIRGGGSNFGVVTEFVLKLYPQRRTIWGGLAVFLPTALEDIWTAAEKWWARDPSEKEALLINMVRGPDGNPAIGIMPFWNGPAEEGREVYKDFFALGPVADFTTEMPYEKLNTLINPMAGHGKNVYMKGVSETTPSVAKAKEVFAEFVKLSSKPGFGNSIVMFEYVSRKKIMEVPHDATAFRSRGPQNNVLVNICWDERDDAEKHKYGKDMARSLGELIARDEVLKESDNIGYTNYESEDNVDVSTVQAMFGNNYQRLQAVKAKYDPDNLFFKWFPIKPAA